MELDAELIEARLRERAHAFGRGRSVAQPDRGPAERTSAFAPPRQHPAAPRRPMGFRWAAAAAARCLDCASEIASERLAAMPGAARCMGCQRSFERGAGTGLGRVTSNR